MMNADEIKNALQAPFPPSDIEWRVSRVVKTRQGFKAIVLAYVTNRAIMNRLDDLFGIDGWKNEYEKWRDKGTLCRLSIKIGDEWVTKSDGADETNIEGTKGGFSAAMKRAAVQFGIGRYLYNLDETWVDIKDHGDHYINAEVKVGNQKERVKGYWDTPILPDWALPEGTKEQRNTANNASHPVQNDRNGSSVIRAKVETLLQNGYSRKKIFTAMVQIVGRQFTDMDELTDIEQQKINRALTEHLNRLKQEKGQQKTRNKACTDKQRKSIFAISERKKISRDELKEITQARTGKQSIKELTVKEASELIAYLEGSDVRADGGQEISDEELDEIFASVDARSTIPG